MRAAQQRSDDTLLRALMVNVPGAIYRSAWHANHTLALISDEIERISGYPPENFIASAKRTLMSIVHPDDHERVMEEVSRAAKEDGAFVVEYRIVRADGGVRWVLDRGQLIHGPGGRRWMDGAIFDITDRREAEEALRRREVEEARTAELLASRARIVEAADAARRKIERDLHDGAQQRLVTLALDVRVARSRLKTDPESAGPVPRPPRPGALAGVRGAARARARHPPRGADRPRARSRDRDAGRARDGAGRGRRAPRRATAARWRRRPRTSPVSEALTNVAKYAHATHATVRLANDDDSLVVEVQDDGIGGAKAGTGSGLSGLADRVGAVDGSLIVTSPPGQGTLVRAVLPLHAG